MASPAASMVRKSLRYAVTGVLVTLTHTLIAVASIRHLGIAPPAANGIAFVLATLLSYAINTVWSFSAPLHGRTLGRFLVVSAIGLLLAIGVAESALRLGLHYLAGIAAVALTVPPVTFLLHACWTYRSCRAPDIPPPK